MWPCSAQLVFFWVNQFMICFSDFLYKNDKSQGWGGKLISCWIHYIILDILLRIQCFWNTLSSSFQTGQFSEEQKTNSDVPNSNIYEALVFKPTGFFSKEQKKNSNVLNSNNYEALVFKPAGGWVLPKMEIRHLDRIL